MEEVGQGVQGNSFSGMTLSPLTLKSYTTYCVLKSQFIQSALSNSGFPIGLYFKSRSALFKRFMVNKLLTLDKKYPPIYTVFTDFT
jgi:hypothetical protein